MVLGNAEFGQDRGKVHYFQLSIVSADCCEKLLIAFLEKRAVFPHIRRNNQLEIKTGNS